MGAYGVAQFVKFIFAGAVLVFIVLIALGIIQWIKNNRSPKLTVNATVESKRKRVSRHTTGGVTGSTDTIISWFVTFSFEGGDRKEFYVKEQDYKKLTEGDKGKLTFQGTRFIEFERE